MTNPNDLQQDHFYKNEAISCLPGVQSWQNQLISLLSFNSRMRLQFFVIPLDLSEGSVQTYVENCPVCCRANTIHVQIDDDGDVQVWAEPHSIKIKAQTPLGMLLTLLK